MLGPILFGPCRVRPPRRSDPLSSNHSSWGQFLLSTTYGFAEKIYPTARMKDHVHPTTQMENPFLTNYNLDTPLEKIQQSQI